jgi:hypothetical protein
MLACPCGCGETLNINLDPKAGPAWRLFERRNGGVSLFPSVWRDTGCKSHFIIWRSEILLLTGADEDTALSPEHDPDLSGRILKRLDHRRLEHFTDIAGAIDAVPWDVLLTCRLLATRGELREGQEKERGKFGLVVRV